MINYSEILKKYIKDNFKNVAQFCKQFEIHQGNLSAAMSGKRAFDIVAAKKIEDKIYAKTNTRIFSNDEQIPIQCIEFINLPDHYILDPHVLAAVGTTKENLKIFKLSDLSMSPIFHKDTLILVNISDKEITPGKFYAIEINGEVAIRRLVKSIGSDIYTAKPENINFESQFFNPKQDKLIGRCVHICGQNI